MKALLVAGLGYGDEGKGSIVDYLTRAYEATEVVRYNGGPQAAHNVTTPDGRHHTFSQFGSGTLAGVRTYLSRYMLVNPLNLFSEAAHLQTLGVKDPLGLLTVSADCPIVTPWHVAANRMREKLRSANGEGRHGSCGEGVGECVSDSLAGHEIRARDLTSVDLPRLLGDCRKRMADAVFPYQTPPGIKAYRWDEAISLCDPDEVRRCCEVYAAFARNVRIVEEHEFSGTVIFEGAQGVLLDEKFGFAPYHTWSNTTLGNAQALVDEHSFDAVERIGVTRHYMTRHGPGPFVTEIAYPARAVDGEHNGHNEWQRSFRLGMPDLVALQYALEATDGVDYLAVTCCDRTIDPKVCTAYHHGTSEFERLGAARTLRGQEDLTRMLFECEPVYEDVDVWNPTVLGCLLDVPVGIESRGPTSADKRAYGVCV